METKYTSEDWDDFWKKRGPDLKEAGVGVQERRCVHSSYILLAYPDRSRYLLWCMKKYKTGEPIAQFAHEPRPKKTIRGYVKLPNVSPRCSHLVAGGLPYRTENACVRVWKSPRTKPRRERKEAINKQSSTYSICTPHFA